MIYTYAYPRPSVTVDIIVYKKINNETQILLIERGNEPFKNMWALPGGFIDVDTDVELKDAAYRELKEETSINDINLEQFRTYGKIGRDPRGRTISIIFTGCFINHDQEVKAGDDAASLKWFKINELPDIAFDHKDIINDFLQKENSSK